MNSNRELMARLMDVGATENPVPQDQLLGDSEVAWHACLEDLYHSSFEPSRRRTTNWHVLPPAIKADTSKYTDTRFRLRCEIIEASPNHVEYVIQEQLRAPVSEAKQLAANSETAEERLLAGERVLSRSVLTNAVTTGTTNFPALTTYANALQEPMVSMPMLDPDNFNLWSTPLDSSTRKVGQILTDADVGLPKEGVAQPDDDPAFLNLDFAMNEIDGNTYFSQWSDFGAFVELFPQQLSESLVKNAYRQADALLVTGSGSGGQIRGIIKQTDDFAGAPVNAPASYTTGQARANAFPFTIDEFGDAIDNNHETILDGDKVFFLAHRSAFQAVRMSVIAHQGGAFAGGVRAFRGGRDVIAPKKKNLFGEFWDVSAISDSNFPSTFNVASTTLAILVNGDRWTTRIMPPVISFNPFRQSNRRLVVAEITMGVGGLFIGSPGEGKVPVHRFRTNA